MLDYLGSIISIVVNILLFLTVLRVDKNLKKTSDQQDRIEQNIFQIQHNVNLIMQQQARMEQEIKQIRADLNKDR